jgi:hypothetical protein
VEMASAKAALRPSRAGTSHHHQRKKNRWDITEPPWTVQFHLAVNGTNRVSLRAKKKCTRKFAFKTAFARVMHGHASAEPRTAMQTLGRPSKQFAP